MKLLYASASTYPLLCGDVAENISMRSLNRKTKRLIPSICQISSPKSITSLFWTNLHISDFNTGPEWLIWSTRIIPGGPVWYSILFFIVTDVQQVHLGKLDEVWKGEQGPLRDWLQRQQKKNNKKIGYEKKGDFKKNVTHCRCPLILLWITGTIVWILLALLLDFIVVFSKLLKVCFLSLYFSFFLFACWSLSMYQYWEIRLFGDISVERNSKLFRENLPICEMFYRIYLKYSK